MTLTPKSIYADFASNSIDKASAVELLIDLIEHPEDIVLE